MDRAYRIAFLARRYRLLSERPQYLTSNRAELIERMLDAPVAVGDFDRSLILHSSEVDRLCAHAVRLLVHRAPAAVLDMLGVLDADRIAGMYYALTPRRQAAVRRDPAWGYHLEHAPPETGEAVADLARLAEDVQEITARLARSTALAPRQAREQTERWDRAVLRQEAGLPSLFLHVEHEIIAQADERTEQVLAMGEAFFDEISAAGDITDDEAFEAACVRARQRYEASQ